MVISVLGTVQCQNHRDVVQEERLMLAHIQCHMRLMLLSYTKLLVSQHCQPVVYLKLSTLQHKHEVQACAQPMSVHNNHDDSNHQHAFQLMLGTCRTSLVLCIPVSRLRPTTLTLLTTCDATSLKVDLGRPDG